VLLVGRRATTTRSCALIGTPNRDRGNLRFGDEESPPSSARGRLRRYRELLSVDFERVVPMLIISCFKFYQPRKTVCILDPLEYIVRTTLLVELVMSII